MIGFGAGAALYLAAAISVIRHCKLRFWVVLLVAGTTMFWQEFYADWAIHLEFPDAYSRLPWGTTAFTQEVKPWCVVPLYAWYFSFVFPLILASTARIRAAKPAWNRTTHPQRRLPPAVHDPLDPDPRPVSGPASTTTSSRERHV